MGKRVKRGRRGQAIVEYILMVIMLAVTIAVVIRNANLNVYCFWTGIARVIASPCPHCKSPMHRVQAMTPG